MFNTKSNEIINILNDFSIETIMLDADNNIVNIIEKLNNALQTVDDINNATKIFYNDLYASKVAVICLYAPISYIDTLRRIGLSNFFYHIFDTKVNLVNCMNLSNVKIETVFRYDEMSSFKRSYIAYLYNLPNKMLGNEEIGQEIKINIWNALVNVANQMKDIYGCNLSDSIDFIVSELIEICHNDTICNDYIGMETFYNKFLKGYNFNMYYNGAGLYEQVIHMVTVAASNIINFYEQALANHPNKIYIAMHQKLERYRFYSEIEMKLYPTKGVETAYGS